MLNRTSDGQGPELVLEGENLNLAAVSTDFKVEIGKTDIDHYIETQLYQDLNIPRRIYTPKYCYYT